MLLWFASGVVMLFVRWPEVSPQDRAAALAPLDWSRCCAFRPGADARIVSSALVEDLGGRPVVRLDDEVLDLATGGPLAHLTRDDALRVARGFAQQAGIYGTPVNVAQVLRDQWTVTGYFNKARPFWKVRLSDERRTELYVSMHTGAVVQRTDRPTRFWNWLGSIPHWLYPTILRQDVKLWTQVVIWTSLIGVFLTLTGLYLGIVAWRPWADRRLSPFRGLMAWHHLTGLFAGLLTLTWVASGLVSMNPWGFLEGGGDEAGSRIAGEVSFGDVERAILAAKDQGVRTRQLRLAPLDGQVFLMADGVRLGLDGRPAPLPRRALEAAGKRAGAVAHQEMIGRTDAYYHDGHDSFAPTPAWRVVLADGTRLYLDPASGEVRARFDREGQWFRWLFEGLHRFDFIRGFDRGAGWAAAMLAMLLAAGAGVATGLWLGWRRIAADLTRLLSPRA